MKHLPLATLLVIPLALLWVSGPRAFGPESVDLSGHLWTIWNATQGPMTHSALIAFPDGVDLLPVVGGWADIWLGSNLTPLVGVFRAYDLVLALYLLLAGLGGRALARVLGAGAWPSVVAGLLLQLDGFVVHNALSGRPEQVGLGAVAMALALAVRSWRTPGWRGAAAAGLALGLVVWVSWELATTLALSVIVLAPGLWKTPGAPGAWRRQGLALVVALLGAGPLIALFLSHAAGVRAMDEGAFAQTLAARSSVGLDWLLWGRIRPAPFAMLCLLALPWTWRPDDRRLWAAALVGLGLAMLLALGPVPQIVGRPPALPVEPRAWAPFTWLQSLPVLGWYHWPNRLLSAFSLAAPVAAALALTRFGRRHTRLAIVLALVLIASALQDHRARRRHIVAEAALPDIPLLTQLRDDPRPGAVIDLPLSMGDGGATSYQRMQMVHRRPIHSAAILSHLLPQRTARPAALDWLDHLDAAGPPPPLPDDAWAPLRSQGFGWIVLHLARLRPEIHQRVTHRLEHVLGPADLEGGGQAWVIPQG